MINKTLTEEEKALLQDRINKAFRENVDWMKANRENEYLKQIIIEIEKFENQKEFKVKWN